MRGTFRAFLALAVLALSLGGWLGWRARQESVRAFAAVESARRAGTALETAPFPLIDALAKHAFEDVLPPDAVPAGMRAAILSLDPKEPRIVWQTGAGSDRDLERVAAALAGEQTWPELAARGLAGPPAAFAASWLYSVDAARARVLVLHGRRSGARVVVVLREVDARVE